MQKSVFKIQEMDCPAEEALVRNQLAEIKSIKKLDFDLETRTVAIFHDGGIEEITQRLADLGLGSMLISSEQTEELVEEEQLQTRVLWIVLIINLIFFGLEIITGFISRSMGLIADSLDMLADASVYMLSIVAIGASVVRKKRIARVAGYFQITLAVLGFAEVVRRFLGNEVMPDFRMMIGIAALALIANTVSLIVLQKAQSKEAHIQASMIFTSNDIIINLGVILAGVLVLVLHSSIPDLIIGSIVFIIVIRGSKKILALAR